MKDVLHAFVGKIERAFGDPRVASMASDALERTLADTLTRDGDECFVITGDIPAMWLRDSTTQLWPYLRMLGDSPEISDIVAGVLRRQFRQIEHDPYANSFNPGPTGAHYEPDDLNDDPWVWEQKYEIDSLAFPLLLSHRWWRATGRTDVFDDRAHRVFGTIVAQLRLEQQHESRSPYRFVRPDAIPTETLVREGLGTPVGLTGMTWSGFRPSDDACTYGYNVPGNLLVAQGLRHLAEIAVECFDDASLAQDALTLAAEIVSGVQQFGLVEHPQHGLIYAYEVDGLGGELLMDDANMPSLLSLPLLSPDVYDPQVYARTRSFVLGPDNPWWFSGTAAQGVGSPHTRGRRVWPIALAVEGLTSGSADRQRELIALLLATDAGTGRMHEAFDVDDPSRFSRPWFSWADSMFCELALTVAERPQPSPTSSSRRSATVTGGTPSAS